MLTDIDIDMWLLKMIVHMYGVSPAVENGTIFEQLLQLD